MVLCKFFQQGNCRFGSKCVNEHFDVKQVIKTDVEAAINGKQWPLSTYGPFKDKPSMPNFIEDQSFEEVRMLCYEAKQKNFFDQFHQQFNKEALEASSKMKALLQMTPEIIDVAISVYDMASDTSCSGATAGKTSNSSTNNPFGMTNAASTNAGSIFAKSNTNTSNNLFGNSGGFAATNQSTNNLFGNTSGFPTQQQQPQQQNSIFGQASKPANSIFGGGTNTNAQQKPSIFGQQQAQTNIFATTGQQQQQTSTGIFGQQNQFATQQNQPNANIFRQAAQPPQGLFAQAAQNMAPQQPQQQQGLFAQAAQQTMGQAAAPGQGLFAQAAQQSQNIFGQAMQQQQQQQQQQTNTNIFQQNQANPNIFQQTQQNTVTQQQVVPSQPPSGLFQQAALQTPNNVSSTLYSRLEDLTPDEVEAFKADYFLPGKIPFNPPPRELIH
ncbi:Nucleoporin NUP116/NSP116 [Lucilia cuprina]|nr:Nucleoporin NUP116/NSP116 [Lucilia cuprina]